MSRTPSDPSTARLIRRVIFGMAVIGVGVVLLLNNLGILDFELTLRFWPCILVLMGVTNLATRSPLNTGGHVLILIGIGLQMAFLDHGWMLDRWWPLGLVWVGLVITARTIWNASKAKREARSEPTICEDATERNHEHQS